MLEFKLWCSLNIIYIDKACITYFPPLYVRNGEADGRGDGILFPLLISLAFFLWYLGAFFEFWWELRTDAFREALLSPEPWSCSSAFTTVFILGLSLGSIDRHCSARYAAFNAASSVYWPSIRASITCKIFRLLVR